LTAISAGERLARIKAFAASAPIARWLGFSAEADGDDVLFRLAFSEAHIGNPSIRAIHGGVIASFLQCAMQAELPPKAGAVTVSIDYLASSRAVDMVARVRRIREGRRLSFLEASGWQGDDLRLVATARGCFRMG
jgi:acyl-coenzyme A thioesterase PaaI-like protein